MTVALSQHKSNHRVEGTLPVDRGPWSAHALTRRALADLAELAKDMHGRHLDAGEILHQLHRQAMLWTEYGAPLPADAALSAVRRLPGLRNWHPLDDWQARLRREDPAALVEGIDGGEPDGGFRERHRRALILSAWLADRAGSEDAEDAVQAVERDFCSYLEGRA